MKLSLTIFITLLLFGCQIDAQEYHESVFSNLEGSSLSSALKNKYKTSRVLSYKEARQKMYGEIDRIDGKLTCIYTGFSASVRSGISTGEAYDKGFNCEHSWPQSKGATGTAKSDMHHLFPTRIDVNSARGSLPFGEINDSSTDKWFKGSTSRSSKPTSDIDSYSELDINKEFEPREDIKGDVARAAFYFRTMYSSANTTFFNQEVKDLCQWHLEDPVDEKEWVRNNKIAKYQGGKKNPFVLDCSIARLYCDNVTTECYSDIVGVNDDFIDLKVKPNPAQNFIELQAVENGTLSIFSYNGRLINEYTLTAGVNKIDITTLLQGMYIFKVVNTKGKLISNEKFIKL